MSCSLSQIKEASFNKIFSMIKENENYITIKDNTAFVSYNNEVVGTKSEALEIVNDRLNKIKSWSNETFNDNRLNWTNVKEGEGYFAIDIYFPQLLEDSYNNKLNEDTKIELLEKITASEYVYEGNIYSSLEDMQRAINNSKKTESKSSQINFSSFINSKKSLVSKLNHRLSNLKAKRKIDNTPEIREEISYVVSLINKLNKRINDLLNADDILDKTLSTFYSDMYLIDDLLSKDPSIENIFTAEYLINTFETFSDYSAKDNPFLNTKDISKIPQDVLNVLDKLRGKVESYKARVIKAKQDYLLDQIENSAKLKSLYPEKQVEEIRDLILKDTKDINFLSKYFLSIDKSFTEQDSILSQLIREELDKKRSLNKSYAATLIQRLNKLVPAVQKKLIDKGYSLNIRRLSFLFSDVNYSIFRQKTKFGNNTDKLISKFSKDWFDAQKSFFKNFYNEYHDITIAQDADALNDLLVRKYNWLNEHTEFLDLSQVPEIINHPEFSNFKEHFKPEKSESYKQEVISKIGEYNYNKLVEDQIIKIQDFIANSSRQVQYILDSNGVDSIEELPDELRNSINISMLINSPFDFIQSHKENNKGQIPYLKGKFQSHLRYNTFFPKKTLERYDLNTGKSHIEDSGYYDKNFEEIEKDSDLLEFWEILNEMTLFINTTLSDGTKNLTSNSLPHMKKLITDILLDKDIRIGSKFSYLFTSTKDTIKNLFSTKVSDIKVDDIDGINNSHIKSVQDDLRILLKTEKLKLKRLFDIELNADTSINISSIGVDFQKYLVEIANLETVDELITTYGKEINLNSFMRENLINRIVNQQTLNLPVMMRAFMDMASEYKSQKDSLSKISIYKDLYEGIKKDNNDNIDRPVSKIRNFIERKRREKGLTDNRVRANQKLNAWFNSRVRNLEDKEVWVNFTKIFSPIWDVKNRGEEEKEFIKEIKIELKRIEEEISKTKDPEKLSKLKYEKLELQKVVDNTGRDYTLASVYNSVINRLLIFTGIGYSLTAPLTNRIQGLITGLINDNGFINKEGNFYIANSFINKKGLRYVPGNKKYKNEIKKTRLFINKLDVIQDAANEIDRAKNDSGFTGIMRRLSPFYLTEYVEWHNQVPQILSILMDETIKDENGNEVYVFDGKGFPAHRIDEHGEIVLKTEFATKENIDRWENFSDEKITDLKVRIMDTISVLNGDYSRTGSTYIKKYALGKSAMVFKTWLPNFLWRRLAYKQTSINLNKRDFNGFYTGSFLSKKTNVAATSLITTGLIAMGVAGSPLGLILAGTLAPGLVGVSVFKSLQAKRLGEDIKVISQLLATLKAVTLKMIGLPINIVSGKNLIESYQFNELDVSDAEKENIKALVTEITILLSLTLIKLFIEALLADHEDDEPKTLGNGQKNPYQYKEPRSILEENTYNLLTNQITKMVNDSGLILSSDALYDLGTSTTILNWIKRGEKLEQSIKQYVKGEDVITRGVNVGESKVWNTLSKTFLPSMFRSPLSLGFESMYESDWTPDDYMSTWFYTDYKRDRKRIENQRSVAREELTNYWKKELDYEKDDDVQYKNILDDKIRKLVDEELNVDYPLPKRGDYEEDQSRVRYVE